MQSAKHRAPISALILLSTMPAAAGCASVPVFAAPQSACSSLVPQSLRADTPSVSLPSADAKAGDLWIAFDGQTGRLDVANANKSAAMEIVENCEKRDATAAARLQAPWWKRPFMPKS